MLHVESRIFIHNRSSWSCIQQALCSSFVHHDAVFMRPGYDLGDKSIWKYRFARPTRLRKL